MIRLGGLRRDGSQGWLATKDRVPEIRSVTPSCWALNRSSELPNGGASCHLPPRINKSRIQLFGGGGEAGLGPLRAKPIILLVHWIFFFFPILLSSLGRPGNSGP